MFSCFELSSLYYILWILTSHQIQSANIFSHFVSCFFNCADYFLSCVEAIWFEAFPFVYFCFWGNIQNNSLARPVKKLFPCFLLVVLSLKFRSLIHFELTFMYQVRYGYNLIILLVDIWFSPHC